MAKFERIGSVQDDKESLTGHPVTVSTTENIEKLKLLFEEEPTTSLRKATPVIQASHMTEHKIVKEHLMLFAYKIQCFQPLSDSDFTRRLDFANLMIKMIKTKQIDPKLILFTDECHVDLEGRVNKQNYRHWGTEQPHLAFVRPLHPKRLTIWCAINYHGIIGPFFLTDTIDGQRYLMEILEKFLPIAHQKKMVENYWFQQDGARPHRTEDNLFCIASEFGDRIIGLEAEMFTG